MNRQRTNAIRTGSGEFAEHGPKKRILYISYDGIGEPLGQSQVLGYLRRLTGHFDITLLSFEKPEADVPVLRSDLAAAGIAWLPLTYHRRPPVFSTLMDVLAARRAIRRQKRRYDIAHVRSYVPALIALLSGRSRWGRLLFDIRGFWADERVEGGIWPAAGWLYRIAKRCERWFFAEADAVVTLTEASVAHIRDLTRRDIPIVVIPTCVDLDRFRVRPPRTSGPHAVWSGSIGTWYRFDLVAPLVRALKLPLSVVTRQQEEARQLLGDLAGTIVTRTPQEVPQELHSGDIGLCLIKHSFSKTASAPTRLGEYLAAGMPVVTSPIGDLEKIVEEDGVGVVLRDGSEAAITQAAKRILEMSRDPQVPQRCRRSAEARFDAADGARRYHELFDQLISLDVSRPADGQTG